MGDAPEHLRNFQCLDRDVSRNVLTKYAAESLQVNPSYKLTEIDWTVRLAHHYFSRLSATSSYTLDNHHHAEKLFCDCGCGESIIEHYGDTSLGNGAGWHGYVDILIGNSELPVVIQGESPVSPGRRHSTDVKKNYLGSDPDQALAWTIVFSFLQKKLHPEYKNFLIPCIAASKKDICFYFYDSKHDILLESPAFPIFNPDKSLNKLTLLATWCVVNYKYLCSGITDTMMENDYKAEFFKHASARISIYRDSLSISRGFETVKRTRLEPWHMKCEVTHGKPVDEEQI
ncbi:uncharacterized protein LOC123536724 isoform X2 [Mercenaria mercenaria]|uniref:uncharacterized protein LOC123536724 isoform X2 n=1 Tax=Mercenaria mercenaria TaxID=6596 RepID=UPI00234F9A77|nr:uncharacterized protein LOC123536724 isoform X2 [Mercenaria mercenaria]